MQPNIEKLKKEFLRITKCTGKEKAMRDALNSALLRGHVYRPEYRHDEAAKQKFKEHWAQCIEEIAAQYKKRVLDDKHCDNIIALSKCLTHKHKNMLKCGRFRIGTAQKSLNLYLKHLWCMGDIAMPVHCTVDGLILQAAGIKGAWTKCKDITEYQSWIKGLEDAAKQENLKLAEWELVTWQRIVNSTT